MKVVLHKKMMSIIELLYQEGHGREQFGWTIVSLEKACPFISYSPINWIHYAWFVTITTYSPTSEYFCLIANIDSYVNWLESFLFILFFVCPIRHSYKNDKTTLLKSKREEFTFNHSLTDFETDKIKSRSVHGRFDISREKKLQVISSLIKN